MFRCAGIGAFVCLALTVASSASAQCAGGTAATFTNNGRVYIRCTGTNRSWTSARNRCNADFNSNGTLFYLVRIDDVDENAYVADIITTDDAWIGATDGPAEGQWNWIGGGSPTLFCTGAGDACSAEPGMYENWRDSGGLCGNEPNSCVFDQDCAADPLPADCALPALQA